MDLQELRAEVRELVGAGLFDRCFKPEWADEAVQFACVQAATLLGLTFTFSPTLTVTQRYVTLPVDAIQADSVRTLPFGAIMGKQLLKSTRAIEDRKNPSWRDRNGEPTVWLPETGSTLRLNGQPACGGVVVGYMQIPTAMVNNTDTPDARIHSALHPHLKFAAGAWLLTLEGQGKDMEKADELFNKFGILIGAGPDLHLSQVEVDD